MMRVTKSSTKFLTRAQLEETGKEAVPAALQAGSSSGMAVGAGGSSPCGNLGISVWLRK